MRRQLPPLALEVRQLRDLLPVEEASVSVQELPIRVYCRFRAQNDSEEFRGGQEVWEHAGTPIPNTVNVAPSTAATLGPVPEYTFDRVFGPEASQDDVYAEIVPVVQEVLEDGGNGSILCYGQTSAGKTFTIEGEEEDRRGILPRALETVFAALSPLPLKDLSIHVSMLEIYMERLRDLLVDGTDLSVAEDRHQGVVVRGLQEVPVQTLQHAMEVWHHGRQQRITAATGMNDRSSRSHCIFTLHVARDGVASKLSIVDLAGSECVKKIYMPGKSNAANKETAEEAKAINQSLSTLGLVINRLAKSKGRNVDSHVPYRSSKLTRVLQDSLGGGSRTVLLLNCSISSLQVAETLSTLRFGTRARSCVNVAATGNCEEPMLLKTLRLARQELQRLQARVWPREADDEDDTPFSGLSALSHEQESVSIVEFNSPESGAHRPRFVQHGLELSLVQEAEGSEENEEIPCPRLSIASGFRRSTCSRRTSRRLSCHSRQSVVAACSNPASLPTSPRWHQGLYFSSVSFCGTDGQTECWEHPLTKSEKRSRLISILAKELSGADTELKDVQALANDLQRRCEALQAETEWLGAERDAAVKSGSGESPFECKPAGVSLTSGLQTLQTMHSVAEDAEGMGQHMEQSFEEEASTKVKTENGTEAITNLERLQELEQLRLEKQRLQTETQNLEADKEHLVLENNEMSKRVQSVEERMIAMTAECRKMEETSEELQQKNEKLNAQLERETARAEKELEQLRLEKQRLQTETRNLEADKEHLVLESNEMSKRVQSVEERMIAMTAECRKMEETSEELQQKNAKLNAQLERETARAEKAEAQCSELANESRKTLSGLEHAKQQLQGENKQTQASQPMLQLNAHDSTKIERSMEERIQHLCSERDQLRASSSSLALELQQALGAVKNLEQRLKKFHETGRQEHGRQPEAENKLHSRSTKSTEVTRIPFRASGKCVWTVLLLLHTVWVLQASEKNNVAKYGLGEDPRNLSIGSDGDGFSVGVPFGHGVEETAKFTESSEKEGSIDEMVEIAPSIFDDEDREDQQHDTSLQEQLILSVNKEPTLPQITRPQATQEKDAVAWSALPVLTAFASLVFGYAG